jgi:hypothetical protein
MAVTNKLVLFMVVSSIIVLLRQGGGYGDYYGGGYGGDGDGDCFVDASPVPEAPGKEEIKIYIV